MEPARAGRRLISRGTMANVTCQAGRKGGLPHSPCKSSRQRGQASGCPPAGGLLLALVPWRFFAENFHHAPQKPFGEGERAFELFLARHTRAVRLRRGSTGQFASQFG